jgi:peptide subunit release factor RF-3
LFDRKTLSGMYSRSLVINKLRRIFGGAIRPAGEVKARGERRRVRSDWMAVERGITVSSAVMRFEHEGLAFNLHDTPGHQAPTAP